LEQMETCSEYDNNENNFSKNHIDENKNTNNHNPISSNNNFLLDNFSQNTHQNFSSNFLDQFIHKPVVEFTEFRKILFFPTNLSPAVFSSENKMAQFGKMFPVVNICDLSLLQLIVVCDVSDSTICDYGIFNNNNMEKGVYRVIRLDPKDSSIDLEYVMLFDTHFNKKPLGNNFVLPKITLILSKSELKNNKVFSLASELWKFVDEKVNFERKLYFNTNTHVNLPIEYCSLLLAQRAYFYINVSEMPKTMFTLGNNNFGSYNTNNLNNNQSRSVNNNINNHSYNYDNCHNNNFPNNNTSYCANFAPSQQFPQCDYLLASSKANGSDSQVIDSHGLVMNDNKNTNLELRFMKYASFRGRIGLDSADVALGDARKPKNYYFDNLMGNLNRLCARRVCDGMSVDYTNQIMIIQRLQLNSLNSSVKVADQAIDLRFETLCFVLTSPQLASNSCAIRPHYFLNVSNSKSLRTVKFFSDFIEIITNIDTVLSVIYDYNQCLRDIIYRIESIKQHYTQIPPSYLCYRLFTALYEWTSYAEKTPNKDYRAYLIERVNYHLTGDNIGDYQIKLFENNLGTGMFNNFFGPSHFNNGSNNYNNKRKFDNNFPNNYDKNIDNSNNNYNTNNSNYTGDKYNGYNFSNASNDFSSNRSKYNKNDSNGNFNKSRNFDNNKSERNGPNAPKLCFTDFLKKFNIENLNRKKEAAEKGIPFEMKTCNGINCAQEHKIHIDNYKKPPYPKKHAIAQIEGLPEKWAIYKPRMLEVVENRKDIFSAN
jgi:hypothetical protein